MEMLGNEIRVRHGEIFSVDFSVEDANGEPLMLLDKWENPYLLFSLKSFDGAYAANYWLNLSNRYQVDEYGSAEKIETPKFVQTKALIVPNEPEVGKIVADIGSNYGIYDKETSGHETDRFDVQQFLYCFVNTNGARNYFVIRKADGGYVKQDYSFRVVKQIETKDLDKNEYLFDIRVVCGKAFDGGFSEEEGALKTQAVNISLLKPTKLILT